MLPSEIIRKLGKPNYHYKTGTYIGVSVDYKRALVSEAVCGRRNGWEFLYDCCGAGWGSATPMFNRLIKGVVRALTRENAVHIDRY